jgi:hypothetical protein
MESSTLISSLRASLLFAVVVAAAACQASVGPSPSLVASLTQPPTASPQASASIRAESAPTIGNRPTGSAVPIAVQARMTDPDLTLTLPIGWATLPIDAYRRLIVSTRDVAPAKVKALFTQHGKDIDAGAVRLVASGPAGFGPWIGSILFEVDAGDRSLEAALARIEKVSGAAGPTTAVEQRHISFAFGEAERIMTTRALAPDAPKGSVPARGILYVIRLADGRTLWIDATGPEAAQGFDTFIDASVMTLAPG